VTGNGYDLGLMGSGVERKRGLAHVGMLFGPHDALQEVGDHARTWGIAVEIVDANRSRPDRARLLVTEPGGNRIEIASAVSPAFSART
jgi:hypothetical protein